MARRYALLENQVVVEVRSMEEDEVSKVSIQTQVVDVEDMLPMPDVGWTLVGNCLVANVGVTEEQREIELASRKRLAGKKISNKYIDLIGARNKLTSKTTQQIVSVLTALSPIRALLETGALGTARSSILQVSAGFPDYQDIFEAAINEINDFEAKYGL